MTRRWPLALRAIHGANRATAVSGGGCGNPMYPAVSASYPASRVDRLIHDRSRMYLMTNAPTLHGERDLPRPWKR
eukprot:1502927-Prymnesium_polylepis.1